MPEKQILLRPIDTSPLTAEELHLLGAGVTPIRWMTREEFERQFPSEPPK